MDCNEIELPSNRKFGFTFFIIFLFLGIYFNFVDNEIGFNSCTTIAGIFLVATLLLPKILLPLNIAWNRIGILLGKCVSPIMIGLLYFGIFTPLGLSMRLFKRDELRLRIVNRTSHWISRSDIKGSSSFKNQF